MMVLYGKDLMELIKANLFKIHSVWCCLWMLVSVLHTREILSWCIVFNRTKPSSIREIQTWKCNTLRAGPKEPKKTMNSSYHIWWPSWKSFGMELRYLCLTLRAVVKVTLAGVSCDIPAIRKVCGHNDASRVFDHRMQVRLTTQKLTDNNGHFRLTKLMLLSISWPEKQLRFTKFQGYVTQYYLKFHTLIQSYFMW